MRRPKDRRRGRRGEEGFAAMALVLALMLIMAALAAKFTFTSSEYQHSDQVNDAFSLRDLRRAMETQIAVLSMTDGNICPDQNQDGDNDDAGEGSCTEGTPGTVPWLVFGLPRKAVIDGGGSMVTYVTSDAFFDGSDENLLKVFDNSERDNNKKSTCSFVLVAHGPNTLGATLPSGTTKDKPAVGTDERENVDGDKEFIARSDKDGFDDRVECGSPELVKVTGGGPPADPPTDPPTDPGPEPIDHDIVLFDYHDIHDDQGTFTGKETIDFDGGTLSGNGEEIVAHRSFLDGLYDIGGFGVASEGENCRGFLGTLNNNCYEINVGETLTVALDDGTASSFDVRFNMLSVTEVARVTGYLGDTKVGSLDYDGYGLAPVGDWITDQAFPDDAPFDELRFTVVRGDYRLAGVRFHP